MVCLHIDLYQVPGQKMANVDQVKVKEGNKLVSEAEKSLKTNWLKWNPDFDNAAHSFDKAALCYRNAKAFDKAIQTFELAADSYYKNHALFHSGKALEHAANICRDIKDYDRAADFLQRSSAMYHESGHGDTAGQVLTKAAKLMESANPLKAAYYHLATADLHDIEEKYREVSNSLRAAVNMYARARHLDKMLETLCRLRKISDQLNQHKHICEIAAIEVVIHLHNDDSVAATETLNAAARTPGFSDSDYVSVLQTLIESYMEREEESFHKSCDDSIFKTMDNEVAKLARDLKMKLDFGGFDESPSGHPSASGTTPQSTTTGVSKRDELLGSSTMDEKHTTDAEESCHRDAPLEQPELVEEDLSDIL